MSVGGEGESGPLREVTCLDLRSRKWHFLLGLPDESSGVAAVLLGLGQIFTFGGYPEKIKRAVQFMNLSSMEKGWSNVSVCNKYLREKYYDIAAILPHSRILIFGAYDEALASTVELKEER